MGVVDLEPYYDFIKYAITPNSNLPDSIADIDWNYFLQYCNQQGIIGLVFEGLQKAELKIQPNLLFQWISYSESIRVNNLLTNKRVEEIAEFFDNKGIRSCILKGQLNGLMYPNPILRSPGDIDIWVEGNREYIIRTVLDVTPNAHYSIHHIKFPICQI